MIDRIEESLGQRLPLAALYSAATVENLARALVDANREEYRSPLVPVQPGGTRSPLFFLHGDFDWGAFYCRKLARYLGENQPFYAILPHGLDGEPIPKTIEAMAADRLRVLLAFRPAGPYVLGGFCNGGLVAFEMARQMLQRGLKVDLLLIVDAPAVRFHRLRKLAGFLGFVLRLNPETQTNWFSVMRRIKLRWIKLSRVTFGARVAFVVKRVGKAFAGLVSPARNGARGEAAAPRRLSHDEKHHAYHRVMGGYIPGPYPGRVVLLRTDSLQSQAPDDPTVGWRVVASQLEVCPIPGGHISTITDHFESLAACLSNYLSDPS